MGDEIKLVVYPRQGTSPYYLLLKFTFDSKFILLTVWRELLVELIDKN